MSVDPLTKSYPWYTPYQFAGNKPIAAIDLDGLEELIYMYLVDKNLNVTFLKKQSFLKVELLGGGHGSAFAKKIDTRTGHAFPKEEIGMIQYKYFDSNTLSPVKYRRNEANGQLVEGENELMEFKANNWFNNSIYIGPNNPELKDEAPDYRREPQDLMDASAKRHDLDYDDVGAKGFIGAVIDQMTVPADVALVQRANYVINAYNKKEIDPYTNEPISNITLDRAKKVKFGFSAIIHNKVANSLLKEFFDNELSKERKIDNSPATNN